MANRISFGRTTFSFDRSNYRSMLGFTLVEVMVVVAIIGLLAAVGYPSYTAYVVRAKRAQAKSFLTQVASRQEQHYINAKTYTTNMTDLGYPASPFFIDTDGNALAATSTQVIYTISGGATNVLLDFTLTATPQGPQATQDSDCGNMTLTNTGAKGVSGTSSVNDCW